jgi:hypothetical protein
MAHEGETEKRQSKRKKHSRQKMRKRKETCKQATKDVPWIFTTPRNDDEEKGLQN